MGLAGAPTTGAEGPISLPGLFLPVTHFPFFSPNPQPTLPVTLVGYMIPPTTFTLTNPKPMSWFFEISAKEPK